MIDALITSKTRIKLLLKFFLNPKNSAYLRGLEAEFGESSNGIRMELNRLEKANMLKFYQDGNRKIFSVNQQHPLYHEINSIVRKLTGIDVIVENIAKRLGNLNSVYLIGDVARGLDSRIIDLLFVGNIDLNYLVNLTTKAEALINRKIRYLVYDQVKLMQQDNHEPLMLLWQKDS